MELANIHQLLGEIRKEQKKTQRDVAEALNMEQATVSLYEAGKRGIPLQLLDDWLKLLEIEVKITPKAYMPMRPEEETKDELLVFDQLKNRRNYLIAELRAIMAEKIAEDPVIGETLNKDTGELRYWPYSFYGELNVGLVETRYDHPQQKYLAVEYTQNEVNVYKFLDINETGDEHSEPKWIHAERIYFSEDDFLTIGGRWDQEYMDLRKVTILRKNSCCPDGIEVISAEGFPVRTLLEMQETLLRFMKVVEDAETSESYIKMDYELDAVMQELIGVSLNNRLRNGGINPEFLYWEEKDREAIDVPLMGQRNWAWIEEGVQWREEEEEMVEIQINDESIPHEHLHVLCGEEGTRVIGLIGEEQCPAIFKTGAGRPNAVYRVKVDIEDLNEKELMEYRKLLDATMELKGLLHGDVRENVEGSDESNVGR